MTCALRFSAVFDDARPSPDGKLDLHGVYHDLSAPGFPARQDHLVLVLVLEWGRSDHGRFQFKADLEDSEGNISLTVEGESEVREAPEGHPPARSQLIMPMDGVVFRLSPAGPIQLPSQSQRRDVSGTWYIPNRHARRTGHLA